MLTPRPIPQSIDETLALDQALLDEFGRLLLGLPNHFRDLVKRQP